MAIRAIYENGYLRLLDPVTLKDGEQVNITISSEKEYLKAVLDDLITFPDENAPDNLSDEDMLLVQEYEQDLARGKLTSSRPLSEIIIEDREDRF